MARVIYEVYAKIIDANGTYSTLSGYPKTFDSRSYSDDPVKAQRRAEGEFSETWGAMCKRDDRQVQTVILMRHDGVVIDRRSFSTMTEEEAPEQET